MVLAPSSLNGWQLDLFYVNVSATGRLPLQQRAQMMTSWEGEKEKKKSRHHHYSRRGLKLLLPSSIILAILAL